MVWIEPDKRTNEKKKAKQTNKKKLNQNSVREQAMEDCLLHYKKKKKQKIWCTVLIF